jgi:formamidopyrimidine-DNA glycosylase
MPELPEVETVVRFIKPNIIGKTIASIKSQNEYDKVFATHNSLQFSKNVVNKEIADVSRRAKYIVFHFDSGFLFIHLRMTGRLLLKLTEEDKLQHLTAKITFTDGSNLYFKDYRKFGRLYYYETLDVINSKLGIEPLSNEFTLYWLYSNLKSGKRQMKPLLLDQSFIAGLGNIYVDEALWAAKIHPQQICSSVSRQKARTLHSSITDLLATAIKNRGTTIINFYFGEGKSGNFRDQLKVFGRQDQDCPRCSKKFVKMRVAQRGTHLCPHCQNL